MKPALRYERMRGVLVEWAKNGFVGEPKIVFVDPNGIEYDQPKTEKDNSWAARGHNKDKIQPTNEVVLPTDMEFFHTLYKDEATPLIGAVFNKPRLVQGEHGQKIEAINAKIRARVIDEQSRMREDNPEDPLVINVNLEVPIRQLLQMMIRGTTELVKCNKKTVAEIQDQTTLAGYKVLETSLNRAKQPIEWFQSLDTLVEAKANQWKEHVAAGRDVTADEHLWDQSLEDYINGRAPDPEYIQQYYDGRNAPGNLADGQTDVPSTAQGQGQNPESVAPNEVNMSDGQTDVPSTAQGQGQTPESVAPNEVNMSNGQTDVPSTAQWQGQNPENVAPNGVNMSDTSQEKESSNASTSVFPDAVKIDCDPSYVLDGGVKRKIEGYLKVGRGHSLLIRMNKPEAVPALCELTAAGQFGRSQLNQYQTLSNARQIQRQTDLEFLKNKSINDLHCTFIATQRATSKRTVIGGRFAGDPQSIERHYFQSQLDRAMGKASVDGWIKEIWPDLFEDNGGDDDESMESPPDELPVFPTQKGAQTQKRDAPGTSKQTETTRSRGGDQDYFNAGFVVPDDESAQGPGRSSSPA
jgi:hypothetical protein